jgi:hypothetical protein
MKDQRVVQRAHDIFTAIRLGEVANPFVSESDVIGMEAALDTLCWVLDHDHNPAFAKNLQEVEATLTRMGYRLFDTGEAR